MKIFSPILKGTTTVAQGTTNLSGSFTGSLLGTAATASYADNFTVGGTLTAQTINVQIITSSIEFNTGSTRNGSSTANTHQFTGSVLMSGSLTVGGPALPMVIASTNSTELYTEYRYNTSTVVGYIGNGTGVVSAASASDFGVRAQNNLIFAAGGNNEHMRITSAGNVGIGTTSPQAKLDFGPANIAQTILLFSTGNYKGGFGTADGELRNFIWDSAANGFTFGSLSSANGTTFSEKMRITTTGNVCVGMTTSPYGRVSIKSNSATVYAGFGIYAASNENFVFINHDSNSGYIGCDSTATGFYTPLAFYTSNSARMTISTNGSIGAPSGTNIYNASDIRLKQNISTTTYGLDAISSLNPVKFNWIDGFESSEDGKDLLGFVAQEVQTVIPEAIESFGGNSITIGDTVIDNPLRVNEKFIIPVLVKAIQELSAKNTLLEERLTALENN
jgi:hypothetical protein